MAVATKARKAMGGKKGGGQIKANVQSMIDKLWKDMSERMEAAGTNAKTRSAGFAVTMVKLQRSAFDNAIKIVARVQKEAEKLMKNHVEDASWMPSEGKDIVKEWKRTLNEARSDFQKTVDRSYDLLQGLFERIQKEQKEAAAKDKGGAAKPVAVKKVIKKKPAVKRAATMAAAEKSSTNM